MEYFVKQVCLYCQQRVNCLNPIINEKIRSSKNDNSGIKSKTA